MQDDPKPVAILAAVADFLRGPAMADLSEATAFETRVAAAALDLVRRELAEPPATAKAEHARLERLVGAGAGIEDMTETLALRIRERKIDLATPGVAEHLWRTTLDKVAVDQPGFSLYRRLAGAGPGGGGGERES